MDYKITLLMTVAVLTAGLSFFIARGKKTVSSDIFSFFILAIGLWSLGLAFFLLTDNPSVALNYSHFFYIAALAIPVFFLDFSFSFPEKKLLQQGEKMLIYIIPFLLSILIISVPDFILQKIIIVESSKSVLVNPLGYSIYTIYFIFYLVIAYKNLFTSYSHTQDKLLKTQLRFIFIGTIAPYILAMFFNLILPPFNYNFVWVGPLFAIGVVWVIMRAVYKHNLFDAKVVATEIFTFILWIFILMRMLLADGLQEKILNGILLSLTMVIGIFLIRSVRKEVSQREKIEKLSEEKSEFMSFASHQIKGPLTEFKNATSMILEGDFGQISPELQNIVQDLYRSADHAVPMVQSFLDASKLEQEGGMSYNMTEIDMKTVVDEVIKGERIVAERKGLALNYWATEGDNFRIKADAIKIKQVVFNLIDNAIKYTPAGNIIVSLEHLEKTIRFSVKDSGVGIAKEDMGRIFAKFGRGKGAEKVNVSSNGLGLYLAKEFVDAHKGKIWVESEGPGKGATFVVELQTV